jgi:hypothetical protein
MRIAKAWAGCSVVVATLAVAGCYAPSIRRCELACASGEQCPDGLTCNTNNMCASSRTDLCTGGSDGSIDVPTDVPRDGACAWRPTSNVEPCALDADLSMTDFAVNGTMTVDTSLVALSASQLTGEPIALVKVRDLIVGPAGNLVVIGNRPLVILVAGVARIEGRIGYVAAGDPGAGFTCAGTGGDGTGGVAGTLGSGGGGGGHGKSGSVSGANGGLVPAGFFGAGGIIVGDGRLVPLTMGCAGGRGGGGTDPGRGGGSIQISARGPLIVSGRIDVGGGGGGNAGGIAAGSGGGAGGGILLEAQTLDINNAQLCANGGGGGAGGAPTSSTLAQPGTCSLTAARGGGSGASRVGGGGATGQIPATQGQGSDLSGGAGGGGGGPGWIRLNGVQTGTPAVSTPTFSSGS